MSDAIDQGRRRFFASAAMGVAAAQFALNGSAEAQPTAQKEPSRDFKPGTDRKSVV